MILEYKVTLFVLKLLNEWYFQCSFCDKLWLNEIIYFFIFENRVQHTRRFG